MIRSGDLTKEDQVFLNELIMQFDCYDVRRFTMYCGISRYEMARAMIGCGIRLRLPDRVDELPITPIMCPPTPIIEPGISVRGCSRWPTPV